MKVISKFHEVLLQELKPFNYVLLDPIPIRQASNEINISCNAADLKSILAYLKKRSDVEQVKATSTFKSSNLVLKFQDNLSLSLNLVHKFAHGSLIYLDVQKVLQKKVMGINNVNIPCVEHLFEYQILKSFLELKGISRATFQYFSEFHILVQEDLIEYFNLKYDTSFSNIYQLTDFDEHQRSRMLKKLKNTSANHFASKFNVRWHNFLGVMRQARII